MSILPQRGIKMTERLAKQLEFILEIDKEKSIFRQTHLSNHGRNENDAEHAWHMAVMAFLLREYANEEVDIAKVMLMCLIHDVAERPSRGLLMQWITFSRCFLTTAMMVATGRSTRRRPLRFMEDTGRQSLGQRNCMSWQIRSFRRTFIRETWRSKNI